MAEIDVGNHLLHHEILGVGGSVDLSGYIPYIGATADVDLGSKNLSCNNLDVYNATNKLRILSNGVVVITNQGTGNIVFGELAYSDYDNSDFNLMLGYEAGRYCHNSTSQEGFFNIYMGYRAGKGVSGQNKGRQNIGIGYKPLENISTGDYNTGIGILALNDVTTGDYNVGIGGNACASLTTSNHNIGIGRYAIGQGNLTTGEYNIGIGYQSLFNIKYTGSRNIGIGAFTLLLAGINVIDNVAIGFEALKNCTNNDNVGIGWNALLSATDAEGNTAIGSGAGLNVTTGDKNVCIGYDAGRVNLTTQSDMLYIANTNTATPLILGTFPNTLLTFTATTINMVGNLTMANAKNIVLNTTTGTKIGTSTSQKLAFYNSTPIVQPTALTSADATATDGTDVTQDLLINNMRIRIDELETKLQSLGLVA